MQHTTTREQLEKVEQALKEALHDYRSILTKHDTDELAAAWDIIGDIERTMGVKADSTVLLAHRLHSGLSTHVAGTGKAVRVLKEQLGFSHRRATTISTQAARLWGPLKENNDDTPEDARKQALALRKQSRDLMLHYQLSEEARTVIETKLADLDSPRLDIRETIRLDIVHYARNRSPEDIRAKLSDLIAQYNAHEPADPDRGYARRMFRISEQDKYGNISIRGVIPAEQAAALKNGIDEIMRRSRDKGDTRNYTQRMADAAMELFNGRRPTTKLVVSISAKDFTRSELRDAGYRFPTNTGISLTAHEILRLGVDKYGYVCVHNPTTGQVEALAQTGRSATMLQRIALFAAELVCSYPGCNTPISRCDIHHLYPWKNGGATSLDNLTCHCRTHHSDNDDSRANPNKQHAIRDPETGVVGVTRAARPGETQPPIEFNTSVAATHSAGARIRAQQWPEEREE